MEISPIAPDSIAAILLLTCVAVLQLPIGPAIWRRRWCSGQTSQDLTAEDAGLAAQESLVAGAGNHRDLPALAVGYENCGHRRRREADPM
jgi:hypothetical protein